MLEGECMLTDGRLGFVFITGEAVTLDLPQRWSPVMRSGELAAAGHKYIGATPLWHQSKNSSLVWLQRPEMRLLTP